MMDTRVAGSGAIVTNGEVDDLDTCGADMTSDYFAISSYLVPQHWNAEHFFHNGELAASKL